MGTVCNLITININNLNCVNILFQLKAVDVFPNLHTASPAAVSH